MATKIFFGPKIWIGAPTTQTWWFFHGDWKPGQWLRASMNAEHSTDPEGCHVEYRGAVEILRQWSETRTSEECLDFPKAVGLVHFVQFRVTHQNPPSWAFQPLLVLPRFVVHS